MIFFKHQNIITVLKLFGRVGDKMNQVSCSCTKHISQHTKTRGLKCWDMFLTQHFSLKVATLTLLNWCPIITPLSSHSAATHNELICINVGFMHPSLGMPLWFRLNKTDTITYRLLFHFPKQTNPPKDPHESSRFFKHFANIFNTSQLAQHARP